MPTGNKLLDFQERAERKDGFSHRQAGGGKSNPMKERGEGQHHRYGGPGDSSCARGKKGREGSSLSIHRGRGKEGDFSDHKGEKKEGVFSDARREKEVALSFGHRGRGGGGRNPVFFVHKKKRKRGTLRGDY